jgi:hypothetical protein
MPTIPGCEKKAQVAVRMKIAGSQSLTGKIREIDSSQRPCPDQVKNGFAAIEPFQAFLPCRFHFRCGFQAPGFA